MPSDPIACDVPTIHAETVALLVGIVGLDRRIGQFKTEGREAIPTGTYGAWRALGLGVARLKHYTSSELFAEFIKSPVTYAGEIWPSIHHMTVEIGFQRYREIARKLFELGYKFHLHNLTKDTELNRFCQVVVECFGDIASDWKSEPIKFDEVFRLLRYTEYHVWKREQPEPKTDRPKPHIFSRQRWEFDPPPLENFRIKPLNQKKVPPRKVGPIPDTPKTLNDEFFHLTSAMWEIDNNLQHNKPSIAGGVRHFALWLSRIQWHVEPSLRTAFHGDRMVQVDGSEFQSYHESLLSKANEWCCFLCKFHVGKAPQIRELVDFQKLHDFAAVIAENSQEIKDAWDFPYFDQDEWFRRLHFEFAACERTELKSLVDDSVIFTPSELRSRIGCSDGQLAEWASKAQKAVGIERPAQGGSNFEYKGENLQRFLEWVVSGKNRIRADFKVAAQSLLKEIMDRPAKAQETPSKTPY